MDNIGDEEDTQEEIDHWANALHINHKALLDVVLIVMIVICAICSVWMWHLHRKYHHEQLRRNPTREEIEEKQRLEHLEIMSTASPLSLPAPVTSAKLDRCVSGEDALGLLGRVRKKLAYIRLVCTPKPAALPIPQAAFNQTSASVSSPQSRYRPAIRTNTIDSTSSKAPLIRAPVGSSESQGSSPLRNAF